MSNINLSVPQKAFFWANMYLSSIQKGLQTAHCVSALFLKYKHNPNMFGSILDWAQNSKTIIIFDGGTDDNLQYMVNNDLSHDDNPYPYVLFQEGYEELRGTITCVGIIVPEKIYKEADYFRINQWNLSHQSPHGLSIYFDRLRNSGWSEKEIDIIVKISKSRLAI